MMKMSKRFRAGERAFACIIQEHLKDERCMTHITIFKQDGRLKILEVSEQ